MGIAIQILQPGRGRGAAQADRWALRRRRMLATAFRRALDGDRPVSDEAFAAARALLCDGAGPLFAWAEPGTLRRYIRVICEAVE